MATFHPFSCLPYELRVHIWEMTVEPRVVEVRCDRPVPTRQQCYLTTSTPVPAVLQTCQEARDHGMYKKCFSEITVPGYGAQYVWANLDIDTIDIGKSLFKAFEPVAPFIRYLKFEREMQAEWFYHGEVDDIRYFVNAKEIYIVPTDGLTACIGNTEEHYYPCGERNVFYVDPTNSERVFRGEDGEGEINDLHNKWCSENEVFEAPYPGWIVHI